MVRLQALATIVPHILQADAADGPVSGLVGVLGALAFLLNAVSMFVHQFGENTLALGPSGTLGPIEPALGIFRGRAPSQLDLLREKEVPDPLCRRQKGAPCVV